LGLHARGPGSLERDRSGELVLPGDRDPDDLAPRHGRRLAPVRAVPDDRHPQTEPDERGRGLLHPGVDGDVVADEHDDVDGLGRRGGPGCRCGFGDSGALGRRDLGGRRGHGRLLGAGALTAAWAHDDSVVLLVGARARLCSDPCAPLVVGLAPYQNVPIVRFWYALSPYQNVPIVTFWYAVS